MAPPLIDRRGTIEEKAERAVTKLPVAVVGLILTMMTQIIGGVWFAATQMEKLRSMGDTVQKIERKVDVIGEVQVTSRDMDPYRRQLDDHEVRIRELERRGGRKDQ